MKNNPNTIDKARVVDFSDSRDSEKAKSHIVGFGCYLCDKYGYFPQALGDDLIELQRQHGENIHLLCQECVDKHEVSTVTQ